MPFYINILNTYKFTLIYLRFQFSNTTPSLKQKKRLFLSNQIKRRLQISMSKKIVIHNKTKMRMIQIKKTKKINKNKKLKKSLLNSKMSNSLRVIKLLFL